MQAMRGLRRTLVVRMRCTSGLRSCRSMSTAASAEHASAAAGGDAVQEFDSLDDHEFSFELNGAAYQGSMNRPFFNGVPDDHIRFAVDPSYHLETAIQQYIKDTGGQRQDVEKRLEDGEDPAVVLNDYCHDPVLDEMVDATVADDASSESKDQARRSLLLLKRTMLAFGAHPEIIDAKARLLLRGQFGDDGSEEGILVVKGLNEFPDMQRAFENNELFDIVRAPDLFSQVPPKMDALTYFCGNYNPTTHMVRETSTGSMYEITGTCERVL